MFLSGVKLDVTDMVAAEYFYLNLMESYDGKGLTSRMLVLVSG